MSATTAPLYQIVNPSDRYTIAPAEFLPGAIAVLLLGNGTYSMKPVKEEAGARELPLLLFGDAEAWTDKECGKPLGDWLSEPANLRAVADALDTVLVGSPGDRAELAEATAAMPDPAQRAAYVAAWKDRRRTSINDIGARAEGMAKFLRVRAEELAGGAAA